jgi:hypothetical protein
MTKEQELQLIQIYRSLSDSYKSTFSKLKPKYRVRYLIFANIEAEQYSKESLELAETMFNKRLGKCDRCLGRRTMTRITHQDKEGNVTRGIYPCLCVLKLVDRKEDFDTNFLSEEISCLHSGT